jgi:cysteine synthase A
LITPGITTLVEPSSGNLGLGIVLIALRKGYRFVAVMPGQYSLDKQILLRYMGAELYLTGKMRSWKLWRHFICYFYLVFI